MPTPPITWGDGFDDAPSDNDQANTIGVRERETRSNVRFRMKNCFNWDDEVDGGKMTFLVGLRRGSEPSNPPLAGTTQGCIYFRGAQLSSVGPSRPWTKMVGEIGSLPLLSRRVFNVVDYGAARTALTDDGPAINAAIAAAAADAGGIVYFPTGTYFCSTTINLQTEVSLLGDGPATSIIKKASGASSNLIQSTAFGVRKCTISGLGFDGSQSAVTGGAILALINSVHDVHIRDCFFQASYSQAIIIGGGSSQLNTISDCTFTNIGTNAIEMTSPTNQRLAINNVLIDTVGTRAAVTNARGIVVRGICNISNVAIFLTQNGKLSAGIELVGQNDATVQSDRCTLSGISVSGSANDGVGLIIGGRRHSISAVTIELTGGAATVGVRVQGFDATFKATGIQMSGIAVGSAGVGLELQQFAEDIAVNGFSATSCVTAITDDGQHNVVSGFRIRGGTTGISVLANSDFFCARSGVLRNLTNGLVVASGAADTRLRNVDFLAAITTYTSDAGTRTDVRDCEGIPVANLTIDGAGNITLPAGAQHVFITTTLSGLANILGSQVEGYKVWVHPGNAAGYTILLTGNIETIGGLAMGGGKGVMFVYDAVRAKWLLMGVNG